jgi:ankyrin repeat protein
MVDNFKLNNSTIDKIKDLFEYIEQGDHLNVAELLANNDISPKSMNIALVKAFNGYNVNESTREIVASLLKFKADPDTLIGKSSQMNALLIAAGENDVQMAKVLLTYGAKVNYIDSTGRTALMQVLTSGKNEVEDFVGLLISYHIDANICDNEGNSPLNVAAYKGLFNVVKLLVENTNVDLDYQLPGSGNTALHSAVSQNRFEIVKYLVGKKAKMTLLNKNKQTVIEFALQMNRTEIYSYLAEKYNEIEETQNSNFF